MREVDRVMMEELHIELLQMMENAGRALAEQARQLVGGDVGGAHIVVLAGSGGNGGGGLAAARRLRIWGADVVIVLGAPRHQFQGVPLHQLTILDGMGVHVQDAEPGQAVTPALSASDLVVDALIGYSLHGTPREPIASLIRAANASGTPLLALDIPSGPERRFGRGLRSDRPRRLHTYIGSTESGPHATSRTRVGRKPACGGYLRTTGGV